MSGCRSSPALYAWSEGAARSGQASEQWLETASAGPDRRAPRFGSSAPAGSWAGSAPAGPATRLCATLVAPRAGAEVAERGPGGKPLAVESEQAAEVEDIARPVTGRPRVPVQPADAVARIASAAGDHRVDLAQATRHHPVRGHPG